MNSFISSSKIRRLPFLRPDRHVGYLLLSLAIAGLAWLALHLYHPQISGAVFRLLISNADLPHYLTQYSCAMVGPRKSDVLFIGDSHSSNGWHFPTILDRLGDKAGSCFMGGLYIESLPKVLDFINETGVKPKVILLGLSPRMFWHSDTKGLQIEEHARMLDDDRRVDVWWGHILFKAVLLNPVGNHERIQDEIDSIARSVAKIKPGEISALLERSPDIREISLWSKRLAVGRRSDTAVSAISSVCERVKNMNASLRMIYIPESPWLYQRYSPAQWAEFQDSVRRLSRCAEQTIMLPPEEYAMDNRHFLIAEKMGAGQYTSWLSSPSVSQSIFDADHMNVLGSAVFTARALGMLLPPDQP